MRRTLAQLAAVMLFSSAVAAAANVFGHKMEWVRRPLDPAAPKAEPHAYSHRMYKGGGDVTTRPDDKPAGAGGSTEPARGSTATRARPGTVDSDAVLEALVSGTACLVDAREPSEYAEGHLRGAINLPSSAIYNDIERLRSLISTEQRVIVYCGGGGCEASHNVSDVLRRDFDFKNVFIYENGWEEIVASPRFQNWIVAGD
ncbi:MAG TPA: rhodanese-like domain-containing protein [Phycisphaerae bacterium]|nr:rhodanese-like domain-containing protein [Phycisphaerae bacterium]